MEEARLAAGIEAILFALGGPVQTRRLAQALACSEEEVDQTCQTLSAAWEAQERGIRLIRLEESWQLTSAPDWGETIRAMLERKRADKLSPAALETLAVTAYFQPVTRVYIDQVRGVDSSHSLTLLLERELIEPCGTLDAPGRPRLYRTTPAFLRAFGLESLNDLPPLPEAAEEGGGEAL